MLALKIEEGSVLMIGNAIVRIDRLKVVSRKVAVTIFAGPEVNVLRFDAAGKLQTDNRYSPAETEQLEAAVTAILLPREDAPA